jgi:hypothetical protein
MLFDNFAVMLVVAEVGAPAAQIDGFDTVTANVAVRDPLGTVTLLGTFTEELLLAR